MTRKPEFTVLHIASGDLWAGAEVQLYTLTGKLADINGISVMVVLLNHGKLERKLADAGINVTVIDEATNNPLAIISGLIRIIRSSNIRIIHTHRTKENILGSVAGFLAGFVPSIRTVHGAPEHKPSLKQPHKYLTTMLDYFSARLLQKAVVAVSNDLAAILEGSLPSRKLRIIENGIDPDEFTALRVAHLKTRKSMHTPLKIGIAGRLVPVKRVDLFINTANYMILNHPEVTASYHIYGDGPLRERLVRLCRELGVADQISFEGHCEEFSTALAGLDVLMMTSDHEGTPMVLLEALAIGVPVIAHSAGGITEVLDNGNCGRLVTDHSPAGYADELVKLFSNTGRGTTPQPVICDRLYSHFSATRNAALYHALYKQVTGSTTQ